MSSSRPIPALLSLFLLAGCCKHTLVLRSTQLELSDAVGPIAHISGRLTLHDEDDEVVTSGDFDCVCDARCTWTGEPRLRLSCDAGAALNLTTTAGRTMNLSILNEDTQSTYVGLVTLRAVNTEEGGALCPQSLSSYQAAVELQ